MTTNRPNRCAVISMKFIAFLLVFGSSILSPARADAQTIIRWTIRVFNAGAAQPLSAPTDLLAVNVICGVTAPAVTAAPNPQKAAFDDPVNAGKFCVWTDPGTGPLLSTPFGGTYEATLTATNAAGTSPESVRASFTHPGAVPPVPTGLLLGR